jgi:uncharacterized membrane protein
MNIHPKIKGETLLTWEAYEYKDQEMKTDWFWALGIIALAGSIASFIYGNFLFGVFIIFASIAIVFFSTIKPKRITYEICEGGVIYEEVFYPFETLHAFWIDDFNPENKKLLLKSERIFVPILALPYEDEEEADAIYEILADVIPEEPLQEPWGHIIMERLGF